jgi:hypothetical protein
MELIRAPLPPTFIGVDVHAYDNLAVNYLKLVARADSGDSKNDFKIKN